MLLANGPANDVTSSSQSAVFENPGTIIVVHGTACAEATKSGTKGFIRVPGKQDLPDYATNAAVVLNGWHLQYLNGDHHVAGLGTAISNIRLEGNTLNWQAAGILSDENNDDAYSWCYNYTVIAWNHANIDLRVDQQDGSCEPNDHREANFFTADNEGTTTALSTFASFLHSADLAGSSIVAILPRGFGFEWLSSSIDQHLFQLAYNLDHSEIFIERGKQYWKKFENVAPPLSGPASEVASGFVSWETSTIMTDNADLRDYMFGELVSGFAGNDVGVIQPPFSILIASKPSGGTIGGGGVRTQEFVIEHVPFKYAIPVLTGVDLSYFGDDQHVKEIGTWISEIHYNDPNDPPGTLRYKLSSVLRDEDNWPDFISRHKVTILGIQSSVTIPIKKQPDLIPFSPSGTSPDAFCRIEGGKVLRVTVKNQGAADAAASKTTVAFADKSFTVDTPPIPAGGSVDLLFAVPSSCFNPDCPFRITVDSSNQINEGSNEGNNSASGMCNG